MTMDSNNNNNDSNNGNGGSSPASGSPNANRPNMGRSNFAESNSNNSGSNMMSGGMNPMMMNMMGGMPGMNSFNMPNQDMMAMMCGPAGSGGNFNQMGGNFGMGGGFGGMGMGFNMMDGPQGMNPQAMQMMMQSQGNNNDNMRKRSIDDEDPASPSSKRINLEMGGSSNNNSNSNDNAPPVESSPKPSKPHITIPPSKEGIKFYSRNDVLCGRGGGTNVHPGNRRFRDLINANRRAYLKARKNDKPAISRSIVRTIREMNGRFLKKDEKQGLWFEIGDDGAREKTSQALRQRAPEMRKILFEDEQRVQQAQAHEMMMQRQFQMQQNMMMNQGNGIGNMLGGPNGNGMNPMQMQMMMQGGGMGGNMGGGNMNNSNQGSNNQGNNNNQDNQDNDNDSNQGSNNSNPQAIKGGGNNDTDMDLMAKYNMLHQKNWLAQEKSMILQRLANMQGGDGPGNQGNFNPAFKNEGNFNNPPNIDTMTTQTLLSNGPRGGTPRGA